MKTTSKKKILLTGGAGFIGRNIIEQLQKKYTIFAPPYEELDLLNQVAVANFFKKHAFDTVIHAANIGVYNTKEKPNEITAKNILMFFNIVRQFSLNQKMIFLGSGAEYDKSRDLALVSEDDFGKHIPRDSYGFAKYTCSKYIEASDNIINLRCFGVYGKYEEPTRFISSAIISALKGKPIIIRKNAFFDYLYIDDLVKIIDHFITHKAKHKFYNVASGNSVDLLTLAKTVKKFTGHEGKIILETDGLSKEYTANANRLKKETSIPLTLIEEGIKNLTEYYKKNPPNMYSVDQ